MKLLDLEPEFLQYKPKDGTVYFHKVDKLEEADGILFLCPVCFQKNNGPVGTHSMICWFTGKVQDDVHPKPGRWTPAGTLETLTFVGPGLTSVEQKGGCNCHFHIDNGEIKFC